MEQQVEVDHVIRRYLLGDLPEEAQIEVEERLLADPEYFSELLIAENDLTDDYVQGSLSDFDKERAARYLLAVPEGRQKLSFAKALNEYVSEATPLSASSRNTRPSPYRMLRDFVHTQASRVKGESTLQETNAITSNSELTWEYMLTEAKSNRDLLSSVSDNDWLGLGLLAHLRSDSLLSEGKLVNFAGATHDVVSPVLSTLLQLGLMDQDEGLFFVTEVGVEILERVEDVFRISLQS